jgi:hypothetical protein
MTRSALRFERFDTADGVVDPTEDPAYLAGFDAGLARGLEQAANEQSALRADLVQAIADLEFGYAEASRHMLDGVAPLLGAIADQLLPAVANEVLTARISGLLLAAATDGLNFPVTLAVAPGQFIALQDALPTGPGPGWSVMPDPSLAVGQARWSRGATELQIDLSTLIDGVRAALTAVNQAQDRTTSHA